MTKTKEEEWVKKFGWKQVSGYKIKIDELRDALDDGWDSFFVLKEDFDDFIETATWWGNDNDENRCFEDIGELIEFIEENSEGRFEEWLGEGEKK